MPLTEHDRHNMLQLTLGLRANSASLILTHTPRGQPCPVICLLLTDPITKQESYHPFALLISPSTLPFLKTLSFPSSLESPVIIPDPDPTPEPTPNPERPPKPCPPSPSPPC